MNHPQVPLGQVADFVNGAAFKPEDWGVDGLPIIRIQNLTDLAKPFNYTERIVPEKLVVNPGDLLVSWSATLGVFKWNGPKGLLNQHIFRVLPNDEVVDKNYLKHTLGQAINDMERHLHGATMKHVNRAEFLGTRIPLPPLEEQRHIAAILDKCNDIQVADRKRCETLERFQASYFRHLFGEPSIFNESWPPRALVSCSATIQTGPFGSLLHQSDYIRCGIPVLNPKHIVNGVIACGENETIANHKAAELSGYQLKEGDVLLARRGEMGRCAVVTSKEDGWLCGTGSMFIRPSRDMLAPEYLCALLSSRYMRSRLEKIAIGATLLNLNAKIISDLSIPVPPIDIQRRYTDVLARLSKMGEMTSKSAHARSVAVASVQNKLLTAAGS